MGDFSFIETVQRTIAEMPKLRDENAKLRELVREIWTSCPVSEDDCAKCSHRLHEDDEVWCDIPILMEQLGVLGFGLAHHWEEQEMHEMQSEWEDRLMNENAKLRELVDYMTPIAWYEASEQERDRMRELGAEVD